MAKMKDSLIIKLILGVIAGLVIGLFCNESVIGVIQSIKFVLGQLINFTVPLIILGFIAPAITKMKSNASKMLGVMLLLAYTSSVGAAFFSMIAGYTLIPKLNIVSTVEGLRELPEMIFKVEIPPVFSVMSALVLALFLGLAVVWTKSENFERLLDEFNNIMLKLVYAIIIPILPFFIASTFATLAYEGGITKQLPVFLKVVVIVLIGHFIWLTVLYSIGGAVSGKNPFSLLKFYGPAYLTALGTMVLFIILLGIFAVGAPGVPGGTVMASLGIIISVLGFDDSGVALMLTIFALQDSFGTACNVVGDGALALMLNGIFKKDLAK